MYLVIIIIVTALLMIQTGFFLLFLLPSYLVAIAVNYYLIKRLKVSSPKFSELVLPSLAPSFVFVLGAGLEIMFVLSDKSPSISVSLVFYMFSYASVVFYIVNAIYFWKKRRAINA